MHFNRICSLKNEKETYESCTHSGNVTNAFKRVVDAAVCEVNQNLLNWLVIVLWVQKFGATKICSHFELVGVDIDSNDTTGASLFATQCDR